MQRQASHASIGVTGFCGRSGREPHSRSPILPHIVEGVLSLGPGHPMWGMSGKEGRCSEEKSDACL
jgi:hypothetical protein